MNFQKETCSTIPSKEVICGLNILESKKKIRANLFLSVTRYGIERHV